MANNNLPSPENLDHMIGRRFERLVVVRFVSKDRHGARHECICDCGRRKIIYDYALRKNTKSCGCLQRDFPNHLKHGRCYTSEYHSWASMKGRCLNPQNKAFPRYGGRGIAIAKEWAESFERFLQDVGPRPSATHSIERINNDGNYEPGNCRWATAKEQARNRRSSRMLTLHGQTRPLATWADLLGFVQNSILSRLKLGWSVEDALTKPLRKNQYG